MKRLYVFCFDPMGTLNIHLLFGFLNSSPDILNWRTPGLPGMVILSSRLDIHRLAIAIRVHMSHHHKFFLAEINHHNIEGWLEKPMWDFIYNPPDAAPVAQGLLAGLLEDKSD